MKYISKAFSLLYMFRFLFFPSVSSFLFVQKYKRRKIRLKKKNENMYKRLLPTFDWLPTLWLPTLWLDILLPSEIGKRKIIISICQSIQCVGELPAYYFLHTTNLSENSRLFPQTTLIICCFFLLIYDCSYLTKMSYHKKRETCQKFVRSQKMVIWK